MSKKHVRLALDFTIDIGDNIPDPLPSREDLEWAHKSSERFKRLFQVLLQEKAILNEILLERVAGEIEHLAESEGWYKALCKKYDDAESTVATILAPAIAKLSVEDQEWFKAGEDIGEEYSLTNYCFSVNLDSINVKLGDCEVQQ